MKRVLTGLAAAGTGLIATGVFAGTAHADPARLTTRRQISGHAAAAAGALGICALCFGPWVLACAPLVVPICVARLVLRDHTLWQLVAGAALGGVLSPLVVLALRQKLLVARNPHVAGSANRAVRLCGGGPFSASFG